MNGAKFMLIPYPQENKSLAASDVEVAPFERPDPDQFQPVEVTPFEEPDQTQSVEASPFEEPEVSSFKEPDQSQPFEASPLEEIKSQQSDIPASPLTLNAKNVANTPHGSMTSALGSCAPEEMNIEAMTTP